MVEDIYSKSFVTNLFDSMSRTYGLVNYLSSFGFTERWRKQCVEELSWDKYEIGYDLMSGMGETWGIIHKKKHVKLIGLDLSSKMNEQARKKINENPDWTIELKEEDVLNNSIQSETADFIISSFGLKTFSEAQLSILATQVTRILKKGGDFAFIEISEPKSKPLKFLFMFYLKVLIPLIGKLFLGNPQDYKMLGIYCSNFGDCKKFSTFLQANGLQIEYKEYFFGCATGVKGKK